MMPHVRNYFKAFGYDESSVIPCEMCGSVQGVEVHHVEPRSKFGSKRKVEQDDFSNLIALCRFDHEIAHGPNSRNMKEIYKQIIANR
jgi:hypothetical protein